MRYLLAATLLVLAVITGISVAEKSFVLHDTQTNTNDEGQQSQQQKTVLKTAARPNRSSNNSNMWVVDTQAEWQQNTTRQSGLKIKDGIARPEAQAATFTSTVKRFNTKRSAQSLVVEQSAEWLNWQRIKNLGPTNLGDAPVMLQLGPDNYWMFGRYGGGGRKRGKKSETGRIQTRSGNSGWI